MTNVVGKHVVGKHMIEKGVVWQFLWVFLVAILLASCVQQGGGEWQAKSQEPALTAMERLAVRAHQCWFQSAQVDFKPYKLAPELQSFTGRPRMLLVSATDPTGRPLLVVEASGSPAQLVAYGPLMATKMAKRIESDLERWVRGEKQC